MSRSNQVEHIREILNGPNESSVRKHPPLREAAALLAAKPEADGALIKLGVQARTSSIGLTGTIRATRAMTFLFCSDFFRS